MNRAVVIRAAAGLAAWLLARHDAPDRPTVVVGLDDRAQRVDAGGLEPQLRPLREVASARRLELGEQLRQRAGLRIDDHGAAALERPGRSRAPAVGEADGPP